MRGTVVDALRGGRRVCVVGGAGFLGSHMVNHLIDDRGCKVWVVDNLVSGSKRFINQEAQFIHHDITQSERFLYKLFKENQIEYVLNYAAWPYVPTSFERPLHVFMTNAVGALHVINAAEEAGCKGILQVSSAEIYGDGWANTYLDNPYKEGCTKLTEEAPTLPHSSYGASKLAIDAMVQVRWRESKTPCIALRQFNACGPFETHDYIVPTIISQLTHNNGLVDGREDTGAIQIRLGNNSTRDFLYAGDAVKMAVELLEKGQFGEVYNSGSESCIKIYDLAKLIGRLMGHNDVRIWEDATRKRPWEIWNLQSSNQKIYSVIDYRPKVSLEEALKRTIKYYQDNGNKWIWEK